MVSIRDLKALDSARQELLKCLMNHPLEDIDLFYAPTRGERLLNAEHVRVLVAAKLIDYAYNDNRNETWCWLTEAGFYRLGYEMPDDYTENPFCEDCDGKGKLPALDDEDDPCDFCEGEGVFFNDISEWFALDEQDKG